MSEIKKEGGLRYNEGKLRYDLLEPYAIEQLVKIFTMGSKKYAPNNWLKGLPWMDVISSLKRHLAEFEKGEDFDKESQLLHMAHVAWNAMAVVSYYKHRPEFDNRLVNSFAKKKISFDLDDCIVSWSEEWSKRENIPIPTDWNFSYETYNKLVSMEKEEFEKFYSNLPRKIEPKDIPFDIHCYITSRTLDVNITKKWIENNGFPCKPVYSVGFGKSKIDAFKESGADYHIDDSYDHFLEMTKNGIMCLLLTTPHNQKYDVGYKRIVNLKDFQERFL